MEDAIWLSFKGASTHEFVLLIHVLTKSSPTLSVGLLLDILRKKGRDRRQLRWMLFIKEIISFCRIRSGNRLISNWKDCSSGTSPPWSSFREPSWTRLTYSGLRWVCYHKQATSPRYKRYALNPYIYILYKQLYILLHITIPILYSYYISTFLLYVWRPATHRISWCARYQRVLINTWDTLIIINSECFSESHCINLGCPLFYLCLTRKFSVSSSLSCHTYSNKRKTVSGNFAFILLFIRNKYLYVYHICCLHCIHKFAKTWNDICRPWYTPWSVRVVCWKNRWRESNDITAATVGDR